MAIGIGNYDNIDNSDPANYPDGAIKDDTGANDGTPVNRKTYNDIHQFFFALLLQAGITPNGLPENVTNTYQYILALVAKIRATIATELLAGTSRRATQAEVNTGTNDATHITPLKLAAATTVVGDEGKLGMKVKVVNIGDWNMDSDAQAIVAHGITDFKKIREVSVLIRNDADDKVYPLQFLVTGVHPIMGGHMAEINATNIVLRRIGSTEAVDFVGTATALFDGTDYDSTTYNRGWITIKHIA
jgi:hypothetical protein